MFFSKSLTFGEDEAAATALIAARPATAESEFLERLKSGDAAAFDLLVVRHSADIYALLLRLTENAEEAADLTQETFLRALKAIKNFRGEADLKTWLYRIAVNESRNRFRWWTRRRREKTVSLDAPANGETETPLSETFSSESRTGNLAPRARSGVARRASEFARSLPRSRRLLRHRRLELRGNRGGAVDKRRHRKIPNRARARRAAAQAARYLKRRCQMLDVRCQFLAFTDI